MTEPGSGENTEPEPRKDLPENDEFDSVPPTTDHVPLTWEDERRDLIENYINKAGTFDQLLDYLKNLSGYQNSQKALVKVKKSAERLIANMAHNQKNSDLIVGKVMEHEFMFGFDFKDESINDAVEDAIERIIREKMKI